ncbi:efflux RND transporter periplasmic adaptor subunit [Thalassotalea profundi]|uniref:Hemolysin D n=1 Tax=Thalassotalea profundi TaxID=2036687 RepID=A0ABQ3IN65_9GAMM|nr:efflux RND transporter periplasmic adaptor subunit [Thalassotalea profundi]GHE89285.1 hemolysin D [Thalassotalea profundi]
MENSNFVQKNRAKIAIILGVLLGSILTLSIFKLFLLPQKIQEKQALSTEDAPLYWVAPMDPNYKRDKPGKSPMGMDLIPIYKQNKNDIDEGNGNVHISPDVVNNLGVRTTKVTQKPLSTEINSLGYVTYNENKLIHIHSRVEGWIEKLHVKANGESVTKGEPLYEIYSPELVNAQEEFLLALERNNNQLINAAKSRLISLHIPKKSITQLKETREIQQRITFLAPQSGVIENLNIREGFFVKPETTILSIVDLTSVWVKAEVFERQSHKLSMGNDVLMTLDYLPNKEWHGKISHIHPMLNANSRTAIARLAFDNKNGELKPNMLAKITIQTTDEESALVIPKEALIRTGRQDRVVLVLGKGHFKSIEVKVGRFDKTHVEILSGLNENDEIVSSAHFLLDSESSKSSDFQRMDHSNSNNKDTIDMFHSHHESINNVNTVSSTYSSASATGTVNYLMADHGMINISRSAIEKWNRPPATVDFTSANHISLVGFKQGDNVSFTFEVRGNTFVITEIYKLPLPHKEIPVDASSSEKATTDHSNHP